MKGIHERDRCDGASSTRDRDVVLAIDIGSSSIRCSCFSISTVPGNDNNSILCYHEKCSSKVAFQLGPITTPTGVLSIVDEAVSLCVTRLVADGAARVVGFGFASFAMNIAGFNAAGECITPLFTYMGPGEQSKTAISPLFQTPVCRISIANESNEDTINRGEGNTLSTPEFVHGLLNSHHRRTGTRYMHNSYLLYQLHCFQRGSAAELPAYYQTLSSYILSQWCRRDGVDWTPASMFPVSYSEASWTGLLNYRDLQWDTSLLDHINSYSAVHFGGADASAGVSVLLPASSLPPLCDPEDLCGPEYTLSPQCVARWGCASNNLFSADTKLFLGIGDGAAANWGSESFSDRLGVGGSSVSGTSTDVNHPLVVTIGTSAAARVIVDRAVLCGANGQAATAVPTGLFCYVLNTKHLLVGGALTDAGSIVEWCSNLMLGGDESRLHQCMADLGTEADGTVVPNPDNVPVVLPFWTAGAGERSPGYHAQAVGTISYVNKRTTARQILQAAVEGVSFRLLEIISLVRSATAGVGGGCTEPGPIVGSGGALDASPYWRKLLAILTGSSVVQSNSRENGEATSRGVARYMWEHLLSAPGGSSSGQPTSAASPEWTDCVGGDCVPLDDPVTDQTTSIAFREQLAQRKLRHDMLYHTMLEM